MLRRDNHAVRQSPGAPTPSIKMPGYQAEKPTKGAKGKSDSFWSPFSGLFGSIARDFNRGRKWAAILAIFNILFITALTIPAHAQSATPSATSTMIEGCPVFPADNAWNQDISKLPVHANSAQYIASINSRDNKFLHADFGADPDYGIPYIVVPGTQPKVPITFTDYGDESDPGPYPIPPNAPVEAGGDQHVLVIDKGACILYELYQAEKAGQGWNAASGAVFDLRSNKLRPQFWTSADAAGLPVFAGLVRYDEVQAGKITHALRFTVAKSQRGFILPATHYASDSTDPNLPPMGLRLRLKASFDLTPYKGQARVVLEALKTYGMIVADNGSDWFISGATDKRWDDDDLNQLKKVPGSAFEAVDTGPIVKERK